MSAFIVTDRTGNSRAVVGDDSATVMELIRDAGIQDGFALCGGYCSCATCHVYIEDGAFARLPAISADENELLDNSPHRLGNSRLSCQVPATGLQGVNVVIAPGD